MDAVAEARLARRAAPRLSIPLEYRFCADLAPTVETLPRTSCRVEPDDDARVARRLRGVTVRIASPASLDPDSLHTAALLDLVRMDDKGNGLRRSISYLHAAVRLDARRAATLTDLSAAYLMRAEWSQGPRDVLEALEAAEQALDWEPRSAAARFNRALALDRLGLVEETRHAWTSFLEVDSTSGWADEAKHRRRGAVAAEPPPLSRNASTAQVEAWAATAPQEAQLLGWDHVLGEWGDAVMKSEWARAEARLRLAAVLGFALERRGGDRTLADAVRAVQARRSDPAALHALARMHRDYAAAREAYRRNDRGPAETGFARVAGARAASLVLRQWATAFLAATLVYREEYNRGERTLRALVAEVDTARHPALAGRARWHLGTTLLRRGRYEGALAEYDDAARLLARAGEREHAGAVLGYAGDAHYRMGDAAAGYASMHAALRALRPYRGSVWLHNALWTMANAVTSEGLVRAGVSIQNEGVAVAGRIRGRPEYAAEAHLARARSLAAAGEAARAAEDVEAARAVIGRLARGAAHAWLTEDIRLVQAGLTHRSDPARAEAALDSATVYFALNALRLLPALTLRADVRLARGNTAGAMADLDHMVQLLSEQRDSIRRAPLRASLIEAARGVFDRGVMLRLHTQDPAEALAYLERGRVSFAPLRTAYAGGDVDRRAPRFGDMVIDYALIGDTLLVWTVSDTSIRVVRSHIDREQFLRTIERARLALELRAREEEVRPDLDALYRWLIRPVETQLGRPGTRLVLVADGEISGVPFSALYDARRHRYLVQDHPLRFAGSLSDARQPSETGPPTGRALLVADPAFERGAYPDFERLPEAAAEVAGLREIYPGAAVLRDTGAHRPALVAALRGASVVHYAGHAVFDDERPDRSFLVLAPDRSGIGPDRLTATAIDSLHLTRTQLVVLSACETLRSRDGRTGGFAGLSAAFLHAGARGVVGSLWRVDDELSRPLMLAFHRAYRVLGDGAEALHQAQVELLNSDDPALRSPAAWAGFRFAGR